MENNSFCQPLIVAAFDFDGTMTKHDSLIDFLKFTSGNFKTYVNFFKHLLKFVGYGLGFLSRQDLKESLLKSFFGGMPIDQLRLEGKAFAKEVIPKLIKKDALEKLKMHLKSGHRCVLISANLDVYLEYFAKEYGFHDCLCSKVAYDQNGLVTGKLEGLNCRDAEKVRRLEAIVGLKTGYTLYAYGDSDGDRDLLALADYPNYRVFHN